MSVERAGPLTHAQRRTWLRGYWRGRGEFDPGWDRVWDLPDRPTVQACVGAFAALADAHEILRTTFHLGLDGQPLQLVHHSHGLRLPVVVITGDCPPPAVDRPPLVGSRTDRPWWSLRLESDDGRVGRLTFLFDHIISDGTGLSNLREQFDRLLRGESLEPPALQPIDRAQKEQARLRRADAPREDPFRRGPQLVCPPQQRPTDPDRRYLVRTAEYVGLTDIVDQLRQIAGVSRSTVVLTAVTELLCRFGGAPAMNVASHLNHRAGNDTGVECQMRLVDVHLVRPARLPVREALREVQRQLFTAYGDDLQRGPVTGATRARTNSDRGAGTTVPLVYNYQELRPAEAADAADASADQTAPGTFAARPPPRRTPATEADVWTPWAAAGAVVISVYAQREQLTLDLDVDTWLITSDQAAALLSALPELLRAWLEHPDLAIADAPCHAPVTASTAQLCSRGWYVPESYRKLLPAEVEVRAGDDGRLILFAEAGADEAQHWHLDLAAQLADHLDVLLPDEYHSPTGSWFPTARTPRPPATAMEKLLCAVIGEATGVPVHDIDRTFLDLGIGVEEGPLVVEALARERVGGCASIHFTAPIPLSAVARALRTDDTPMSRSPVYLP